MAYNAPVKDPKYWEGAKKRTARVLHRGVKTKLCSICGKMICGGDQYFTSSGGGGPMICIPCLEKLK